VAVGEDGDTSLGDLVVTGPTNTNLLDLYLLVVDAAPSP